MAATYASPLYVPKYRGFTNAGIPLAAGKVFVFIAGTSTPYTTYPTYADALAGSNANAHPVILDANGEANIFVPVIDSLLKVVLQDSAGVVQWTEDFLHPGVGYPGFTGTSFVSQWRPLSDVTTAPVSAASAVSFQVTGADVTATLHPGRRIQTQNTGGLVTSTVQTSGFGGANTSVVVVNDGVGVIDAGLSQVWYGIISYASPSYLDPRTAFSASKTGNITGFAANTKVTGFAVTVDSNVEWVAASNHWLCKYPGNYLLHAQIGFSNTVANIAHSLNIANTTGTSLVLSRLTSSPVAGAAGCIVAQVVASVLAGGTVAMWFQGDANTTLLSGGDTRLNIARIP